MAILLNNNGERHADWKRALAAYLPRHDVIEYENISNPDEIDYAIVWKHPKGDLRRYPNLKAVLSTGAGTEHFDTDPNLPDAPIFRLIDMAMAEDMALYALYWILHFQRGFESYREQQSAQIWRRHPSPTASEYKICFLGLGAIGTVIATKIAQNGFEVTGWSRSPKNIEGVKSIAGEEALLNAIGSTDVLISCLPLNTSTRGFLNHDRLSRLKSDASIINISRGPILESRALQELLDNGHISAACLDVFDKEPLPKASPLWSHPKIHITPHMSGATNPETAVKIIAESILKLERGETPDHIYHRPITKGAEL